METNVRFEVTALGKRFSAMITYVWFFAGVVAFMRLCIAQLMKPLVAVPALVLFHFGMRIDVAQQRGPQLKLRLAVFMETFVWLVLQYVLRFMNDPFQFATEFHKTIFALRLLRCG